MGHQIQCNVKVEVQPLAALPNSFDFFTNKNKYSPQELAVGCPENNDK